MVYGELSGGAKMTADEIKQMILDEIGKYLRSNGYTKLKSEDLKNLAQAYQALTFFDGDEVSLKENDGGFGLCD